jgi:hypothetical protein
LRQQKSANMFLLIFADFAEIQQTANLLMKTLIPISNKHIFFSLKFYGFFKGNSKIVASENR